jgi:hypothetical protein
LALLAFLSVGHHDGRYTAIVGEGKLTYTVLVANVRLLPVDSELADTLRMGSEQLRRRYGVSVAAETAPVLRGVVEQTLGYAPR